MDLEPDEIEGFESCGRWMIDSQEWELNCDCSKFNSPVLRAGCENFYSMKWDNAAVTYEEVTCPQEIASLPCWEENGNGYPQDGIPETCMDPNGDPNGLLPFPGSPPSVPPPPTVPPPPPTNPPPSPTGLEPIECPAGYETARWVRSFSSLISDHTFAYYCTHSHAISFLHNIIHIRHGISLIPNAVLIKITTTPMHLPWSVKFTTDVHGMETLPTLAIGHSAMSRILIL